MKTVISLSDAVLKDADRTAREMGLSRSRLLSLAIERYLTRHRQEQIIAQLNAVYAHGPSRAEARIVEGMKIKFRRAITQRW
jgi:metal-responsive CopG/Arc/MetJ family transcriptional regulator